MFQSILTLLLLAAQFATQTQAIHATCAIDLGKKPWDLEYQRLCIAYPPQSRSTQITYRCDSSPTDKPVANWNVFGTDVLEFLTPCGKGGYGLSGGCLAPSWAVCIGSQDNVKCRTLNATDDCESDPGRGQQPVACPLNHVSIPRPCLPLGKWKEKIQDPPSEVEIWYKPGP